MQKIAKRIMIKVSDDFYEELKRRAEEEGFALVSDYVLELLSRELGKAPFNPRELEARLERIEKGELPPRLREEIWKIVEEALAERLGSIEIGEGVDVEALTERMAEEVLSKIERKLERKIYDMLNPWTGKVDRLAQTLAELREEIDNLKATIEEMKKEKEEKREERSEERREFHEHREAPRRKSKAFDILTEKRVYFEEDMGWAKNKERLIERLKRDGAVVLRTDRFGTIVVHPDAWRDFLSALESAGPSEEEVADALGDERLFKLFSLLREDGALYYDRERGWVLDESVVEK